MDERDFLISLSADRVKLAEKQEFLSKLSSIKCKNCEKPATKALMWCEHRAYIPSCDGCVEPLIKKNPQCFPPEDNGRPESLKDIQYIIDKKKKAKEKTAGPREQAAAFLAENAGRLAAGAIGAGIAAGLQYHLSKPGEGGGPSKERQSAEKSLIHSNEELEKTRASGKEPTFSAELMNALGKGRVETSKVLEKHPGKSALLALPAGAAFGAGVHQLVKKFIPR